MSCLGFLVLAAIIWAAGAVVAAAVCVCAYWDAVWVRKTWPSINSAEKTRARKRKWARRAFTAYAWPLWVAAWAARAVRDMADAAFSPQDKP